MDGNVYVINSTHIYHKEKISRFAVEKKVMGDYFLLCPSEVLF
jgi:hypothetical protein